MDNALPDDLAAAPCIENIEILSLLGKGGMSRVYKARQTQLDRLVAVKVLSGADAGCEEKSRRFLKEARLTSTLSHANIIKTISFGLTPDGQPYLVMEYLEGRSLQEELKMNGRLQLRMFRDIFLPVLSALGHAHESGLIHRDLKPANIMICSGQSGADTVKLLDFGIAKIFSEGTGAGGTGAGGTGAGGTGADERLTRTGALLGTPAYMSPEQCRNDPLDGRSDLYSLACVMYECLSGQPPFQGDSSLEIMHRHLTEPAPSLSSLRDKTDLSSELAAAVLRGLAKDPADRPQTAAEFSDGLAAALADCTLDRVPVMKSRVAVKSLLLPGVVVALACLLALSGLAYFVQNRQKQLQSAKAVVSGGSRLPAKWEIDRKRILELSQKSRSPDHSLLASQNADLAAAYAKHEMYSEAVTYFRRALSILEETHKPDDQELIPTLCRLADCLEKMENYAECEKFYRRALKIAEQGTEPYVPRIDSILIDLADCLDRQKNYKASLPVYKRSLSINEKLYDDGIVHDLRNIADALERLATCYKNSHDYARAEAVFNRAVKVRELELVSSKQVKWDLFALHRNENAALRKMQEDDGPSPPATLGGLEQRRACRRVATTIRLLADCYAEQEKLSSAVPLYERSIKLREPCGEDRELATVFENLSACYKKQGRLKEAEALLKRAVAISKPEPPAPRI
jgi:serine/threonine protein kinase